MLGERTSFTAINGNMFVLYMVFCWITYVYVSEGRTVQGIKGRNVSLSWTFHNMKKDAILILHGSTPFVRVWLANNHFVPQKNDERFQFIGEISTDNTVTFTVNIMNVTENDAGNYKVERQWDSQEFNETIFLEIFDERIIPRITMVLHNISDSSIVLRCSSSSISTDKVLWKLNGSLIENHSRHSQKNNCISIMNLTSNDGYNLYTCEEFGKRIESEPYRLLYGPDELFFNTSDNAIQVDEFDTISIRCSSDCFPPCQIVWNEPNTETMIPGSELKLVKLKIDVNYTCHATNLIKSNSMIFSAIYIKVKSGANPYTTIVVTPVMDTGTTDFPSTRHFLYVALGMGIILAVGLFSCLLHRFRPCSREDRILNSDFLTQPNSLEEVNLFGNYWTIVSNAKGELSTAVETNIEQHQKPIPICKRNFLKSNKAEESISVTDVNGAMELEDYMDPIHSRSVEHVDYIHPVHSDPVNTKFVQKHHTL